MQRMLPLFFLLPMAMTACGQTGKLVLPSHSPAAAAKPAPDRPVAPDPAAVSAPASDPVQDPVEDAQPKKPAAPSTP